MTAVYNFKVNQGATKRFSVIYKDANDNLIPIDNFEVRGQIRGKASDELPLAEFQFEKFNSESRIDVILPADALSGSKFIKGKSYNDYVTAFYDIELFNEDIVIRILNGAVQISPEITK